MIGVYQNKIGNYQGKIGVLLPIDDGRGGTITYDGDYKIHIFNSSDNFIVNNTIDASVLLVGGGGSGGFSNNFTYGGGGGGGGAQVKELSFTLNPNTYPVIIGSSDHASSFNGQTSLSGGKGDPLTNAGGNSISGFSGGSSYTDTSGFIGGGGGAGCTQNGENAYRDPIPAEITGFYWEHGGHGGAGLHSSISGIDIGYGGGGGGNLHASSSGHSMSGGGQDGGGIGEPAAGIGTGIPGTGGGGGGGYMDVTSLGGSGVVIIRYKYK